MTVTKVQLMHAEGGEDADSANYSLRYLVTTDDRDDGPLVARSAVGWLYGDPYVIGNDSDPRAQAISISESPVSSSHFNDWEVVVDFDLIDTDKDITNPLNDAITEEVSWAPQGRRIYVDSTGTAITSTSGDPIPLDVQDNQPVLTYSLNQATFPFAVAQAARNAINSSSWKGFPTGTVKLLSMSSRRMFNKDIGIYYAVTYSFSFNPDGYDEIVPSFGFTEIVDVGSVKKRKWIRLQGHLAREPQPLDAAGAAIQIDGTTGQYLSPPASKTFEPFPRLDFNTLFGFL